MGSLAASIETQPRDASAEEARDGAWRRPARSGGPGWRPTRRGFRRPRYYGWRRLGRDSGDTARAPAVRARPGRSARSCGPPRFGAGFGARRTVFAPLPGGRARRECAYVSGSTRETATGGGEGQGAQCDARNARTRLRTGQMARTASRLMEVSALSRVNWLAFRIVDDTVHLQLLIQCYAGFVTPV